jgi:hypothetical protein
MAAAWIGLLMAVLTLLLYVPILAMASQSPQILEGINYVADTLLYAGAALLVAGALPEKSAVRRRIAAPTRGAAGGSRLPMIKALPLRFVLTRNRH